MEVRMNRLPVRASTVDLGWTYPIPDLFDAPGESRRVEARPAHTDRVDPPDFMSVKQFADEMLTTGGMAPPIIGENKERRCLMFHGKFMGT
jgi:hypothetical protein